eukprot:SAG31_NODE_1180_length_9525_cov_4.989497_10_plen_33_part_00
MLTYLGLADWSAAPGKVKSAGFEAVAAAALAA